jgi:hypothetical protein
LELVMKGRWLWLVIIANLLVIGALVFAYPHLMVGPGPLSAGHAQLSTDCFACHAPLRGASAARCVACHAVADIGVRTSTGEPVHAAPTANASATKIAFHQQLIQSDCTACHSEHANPRLAPRSTKPFSHALLRAPTREACASCHAAPALSTHQRFGPQCAQCHTTTAWQPTTFDHAKYFPLEGEHRAACATCHTDNVYSSYTCFGCHEHTPAKVRKDHEGEVSGNLDNCVKCHRGGDREGEGRNEGRSEGNRGERD